VSTLLQTLVPIFGLMALGFAAARGKLIDVPYIDHLPHSKTTLATRLRELRERSRSQDASATGSVVGHDTERATRTAES